MRALRIAVSTVALLAAATAGAGGPPSHRTVLTFSGPVALPNVSLSPGSYTFEIVDPDAGGDAVVPGWPVPIIAWYPSGELWERRFIYP
jgi:hypothetical protein